MMKKFFIGVSKYKLEILIGLGIILLYFLTRLIHIGNFPIFTDEAIYTRWAQIAANDFKAIFISLTDGKQPLFIWAGIPLLKMIRDPLVAMRLVSVICGLFSLIGVWLLSYELFKNKNLSFLASLIYVIYPFTLVYDRMALYDSMVTTFTLYSIYLSVLLVRRLSITITFILGIVLGAGLLTKSSGLFSILILPFTLLLMDFKDKKIQNKIIRWGFLAFISAVIAEVMYQSLRVSSAFYVIGQKNQVFVYTFQEWIAHPLLNLLGNFQGMAGWLFAYLTPFLLFLIILSFLKKEFWREKLLLSIYFILPFIALAAFGKVIFPRYVLPMSISLLPLASYGLFMIIDESGKIMAKRGLNIKYVLAALFIIFFLIYPAKISLNFIFDPDKAAIAQADFNQYIGDWPAGGGVRQSIEFFQDQAKNQKIYVGTQGTFGLMPAALEIYLGKNPNITTKGYWPITDQAPQDLLDQAKKTPTYFIFYQPCGACKLSGEAPPTWPLSLISKFKKSDDAYYSVYQVKSE